MRRIGLRGASWLVLAVVVWGCGDDASTSDETQDESSGAQASATPGSDAALTVPGSVDHALDAGTGAHSTTGSGFTSENSADDGAQVTNAPVFSDAGTVAPGQTQAGQDAGTSGTSATPDVEAGVQQLDASQPPDPQPEELVAVAGRYVVLAEEEVSNSDRAMRVDVVEVATGAVHLVAPASEFNSDGEFSFSRDVVFLDDVYSHSARAQTMLRLQDGGFTAPRPIAGYDDSMGGGFSQWAWSADGRYAAVWREPSGQAYIDFIDVTEGRRIGGVPVGDTGLLGRFGGHSYYYGSDEGEPQTQVRALLSISGGEVNHRFELPYGASPKLADNGAAVFVAGADAEAIDFLRWEPGEEPVLFPPPTGQRWSNIALVSADGNVAVGTVTAPDASVAVYKVSIDGTQQARVGTLTGSLSLSETAAREWILVRQWGEEVNTFEVVRHSDLEAHALTTYPADVSSTSDALHRHFYHKAQGYPVTLVGFDDAGPVSVTLPDTEPEMTCLNYRFVHKPVDRDVVIVVGGNLILLDLSAPQARAALSISPTLPESNFSCPHWSKDGKSLAFVELSAELNRVYFVSWEGDVPSAPQLLRESSANLNVFGLH